MNIVDLENFIFILFKKKVNLFYISATFILFYQKCISSSWLFNEFCNIMDYSFF